MYRIDFMCPYCWMRDSRQLQFLHWFVYRVFARLYGLGHLMGESTGDYDRFRLPLKNKTISMK